MSEAQERARVVAAGRSWIATPFHDCARVKGAGVDCLQLIAAAFIESGVSEPVEIPDYSPQWHMHRGDPLYREGIERFMDPVGDPDDERSWSERLAADPAWRLEPADVWIVTYGRAFSHAGLITDFPKVLHAFAPYRAVVEGEIPTEVSRRPMRVYRWRSWAR